MKRILKLLARLYPSSWRERYGSEYEALLEDMTPRARDAFDVFWGAGKMQMTNWSFARTVFLCSLGGAVAAMMFSFAVTPRYLSRTLITVDTTDPELIAREISGQVTTLLSETFLTSVIQRENLYPRERTQMPMSDVVHIMKKDIMVLRLHGSGTPGLNFLVQFVYADPHVAQRVDRDLVPAFTAANLRQRINSPSGVALPRTTFAVEQTADLPKKPVFPKRGLFGVSGLMAGLLSGLVVATVAARRRMITAKG